MELALALAVGIVSVVTFIAVAALLVVVFRNPFGPAWLKRDAPAITVSVLMSAAVAGVTGLTISSFVGAGLNLISAAIVTIALFVLSGLAVGRLFHVRERLRRADADQSPFERMAAPTEQPGTAGKPTAG